MMLQSTIFHNEASVKATKANDPHQAEMVLHWLYGFVSSTSTPYGGTFLAQSPLGELPVKKYALCVEGVRGHGNLWSNYMLCT